MKTPIVHLYFHRNLQNLYQINSIFANKPNSSYLKNEVLNCILLILKLIIKLSTFNVKNN